MKRLPTLDGWRAVAITAVILHHVGQGFYGSELEYGTSLTRFGAFGVDIFFGLSGLLITLLLLEARRNHDSFGLRGFYIRRAFRILPPYLIFLGTLTIAGLWQSGWEAASCLLFFRNYVPSTSVGAYSQHLWSLAVEEHFYLLWPGLLAWLGTRRAHTIAPSLALGFAIWRMIESQFAVPLLPLLPPHFRTDLRLDALLWGCAFAFFMDDPVKRSQFIHQLRFTVWLATAGLLGLSIAYYSQMSSVMVAVLIPILLAGTMTNPQWRLSRALELPPVAWLGRISYSLYLWQQLFLVPGWNHTNAWWQQWPVNLPIAFAAAIVSYYFVEKPCIRMGRRLASLPGLVHASSVPQTARQPASGLKPNYLERTGS